MKNLIFLAALIVGVSRVDAAIVYDRDADCLRVRDYPRAIPCDPRRLAAVDAACGWGKVQYDQTADAYTVNCDLAIGANDGGETYFQVGSPKRPKETLIMNGNVFICPHWVEGENKGPYWWYASPHINRLTLGDETDTDVRPTLKFAPGKTLYTGAIVRDGKLDRRAVRGGQLFVYHGTITAAKDAFGAAKDGGLFLYGDGNVLIGATISRLKGNACYGGDAGWKKECEYRDAIFEDFDYLAPEKREFVNCVFRGAKDYAIQDWGNIDAAFVNCRFENNAANFLLRHSDKGVSCVDCEILPGKKPDIVRAGPIKGKIRYPSLTVQNHLIVTVVDKDDKPVAGAEVTVRPEQSGLGLWEDFRAKTGADGVTPADALLLTRRVVKAADNPDKPTETAFTYAIGAEKDEKKAAVTGVVPERKAKIALKLK